jgi:hypothetical protein
MPLEAPYSAAEVAAIQAGMRDAILQEAQTAAIGGAAWTVIAANGNGVTAPTTPTTLGTIQASIYEKRLSPLARALAGADVPDSFWRLIVINAQSVALRIGQELASQAQPALRFTIKTLDQKYGVSLGELEAVPGGS